MENQRVVFTHAELRDALENFPKMGGSVLPAGEIAAILPRRKDDEHFIKFNVLDFSCSKNVSVEVSEDDVATALIEHCIRIKTPLPKKAEKELRVIDNSVCLDIKIGELGEAYGAQGVLRYILHKQAELLDEFRHLSGRFLGRDTGGEGASEGEKA